MTLYELNEDMTTIAKLYAKYSHWAENNQHQIEEEPQMRLAPQNIVVAGDVGYYQSIEVANSLGRTLAEIARANYLTVDWEYIDKNY